MEQEGVPIDWNAFEQASKDGRLMELLMKLPRERWAERDKNGDTLLHYACLGPNVAAVVALVQSRLVDVNSYHSWGLTPAHWAANFTQPRVLEVLCAAGADVRASVLGSYTPIGLALSTAHKDGGETVRVLVANGVRLATASKDDGWYITSELEAFELGVLGCRAAVVAMVRVKRAGQLVRWDKFLLLELAVCIWSTRYDKGWQTEEPVRAMLPPQ